MEEVTESGFLGTTPTLACSQLGEDALIQVREMNSSIYFYVVMIHVHCLM